MKPKKTPDNLPAETGNTALAEPPQGGGGQIRGDFNPSDVAVPYLSIVGRTGKLPDVPGFNFLDIIYGGAAGISLGKEAKVVFGSLDKSFQTITEYGSGDMPIRFDTEAEAKEHKAETGEDIEPIATLDVLIQSDKLGDFATIDNWAPARWQVRGSAYSATVRILLRDMRGWLRGDLSGGVYKLTGEKATNGQNSWAKPLLKSDGKTSPAIREHLLELVG